MQKDIIKLKELEEDIPKCPYCSSSDMVKYGFQRMEYRGIDVTPVERYSTRGMEHCSTGED